MATTDLGTAPELDVDTPSPAALPPDGTRRLALLGHLARRLAELPRPRDLALVLYETLSHVLSMEAFYVLQADPTAGILRSLLAMEDDVEYPAAGLSLPLDAPEGDLLSALPGPATRALDSGRSWQSILACHIRAAGRPVALIALCCSWPGAYAPEDAQLLRTVADMAAPAFDRGLVSAAEQARDSPRESLDPERLLAAIGAISAAIVEGRSPSEIYLLILRQAAALIPYDEASIVLFEEGTMVPGSAVGSILPALQESTAGLRFWRAERSLDLADAVREPALSAALQGSGMQALLSVPLVVNGVVCGRLTVAARRATPYGVQEQDLAALLAERAAQAIRTAQLHGAQEDVLARLSQLDALRQDFMATVSHELRTPLTGILGHLELLLDRWAVLDDERRRGMLQRVQTSGVRLEHLLADLLLFSSLEYQGLQLRMGQQAVETLVERAVQEMRTRYRGQVIEVRPAGRPALVLADAQRAAQVTANLLDNAIKYSPEGSPVQIRWTVRRTEVEVAVRDRGPGIRPEDLPRLFTRFCTLGHQPRPGQVGTGIGLYVCRRLVEAMNGRIWAESTLGKGSTFTFALPRAAPASS